MLPPFHGDRMRAYGATMRDVTLTELARWPTGEVFPIHHSMQAITLEVIMRTVFGVTETARVEALERALREALAWSTETAALAREHNNAQVVSVGARMHTAEETTAIVETFLTTAWSQGERHQRRIDMLSAYEETGELA